VKRTGQRFAIPPPGPLVLVLGLAAGLMLLLPGLARGLDILPRSFSRSKQFVVYARDGAVRGGVGTLAEDVKNGLLNALDLRDEWKVPIVIDVRAPQPGLPDARPPVQLTLGQTGAGLKIELDLLTGDVARNTRIQDELVRAMLLELAYRDHPSLPAGKDYTVPPPWLVAGLSAYLANEEDGVSAHLLGALLPTAQGLPIDEFLGKDPATMDGTSRGVYQAYAYSLVCLLLQEMQGGREDLVAFIKDLPNTSDEEARTAAALARHFPQLAGSPDSLEKWWTLGLARLAQSDHYQALSVEETEARLDDVLAFRGPAGSEAANEAHLETLADYLRLPGSKRNRKILDGPRAGLLALSGQANPLYRKIILGYERVVADLAEHKFNGVAGRLAALEISRREVRHRREQIADYMNWYEATQVTTRSAEFDGYFWAAQQVEANKRVHRPDAISSYMDAVENEFR
jgi:hypothetical protein